MRHSLIAHSAGLGQAHAPKSLQQPVLVSSTSLLADQEAAVVDGPCLFSALPPTKLASEDTKQKREPESSHPGQRQPYHGAVGIPYQGHDHHPPPELQRNQRLFSTACGLAAVFQVPYTGAIHRLIFPRPDGPDTHFAVCTMYVPTLSTHTRYHVPTYIPSSVLPARLVRTSALNWPERAGRRRLCTGIECELPGACIEAAAREAVERKSRCLTLTRD